LPGVKFACCGHGIHEGYIFFENGVHIAGTFEVLYEDEDGKFYKIVPVSERKSA